MRTAYDVIKRARDQVIANPIREVKESTKKDYAAKIKSLQAKLKDGTAATDMIQAALKTTKKSTWQATRAAMIHTLATNIGNRLAAQDKLQRIIKSVVEAGGTPDKSEWVKVLKKINDASNTLQLVLDAKLPIEGRENRHTKRQDMRGLPGDWRERIIARMPKYAGQALVAAVTGCRPAELVHGIDLMIDEKTGELMALIKGAKSTAKTGQEWRRMRWPANNESPLVRSLFDLVGHHPAGSTVRIAVDDAKVFSGAMRAAGKREWPKRKSTVTPYCMRHQVAADMKAAGWMSSGEISAALGHVSDVTKSTYGHANMGRKAGGVAPAQVESARPVQIKTPSPAARKVTRQVIGQREGAKPSNPNSSPSPSM